MSNTKTLNSIQFSNKVTVKETVTYGADPTLTSSGAAQTSSLGSDSIKFDGSPNNGPNATVTWHGQVALTAGAATLDLTALPDASLGTNVSMSGKKLMAISASPDSANTHTISIAAGASNGYTGWGSIVENGALGPLNYTSAVDGTHKTLDIAGNGTEKLNLVLLFG